MTAPQVPAGWYEDPLRRFARRYWDGAVWTPNVADPAGTQSLDPLEPAPAAVTTTPTPEAVPAHSPTATAPAEPAPFAELEALKARLDAAEAAYGELIARARATKMAPADFHREAFRTGLVVRDQDAWIYVMEADTWFRYDGITLRPLGGWNDGPTEGPAA